jgi:hypothetical protein
MKTIFYILAMLQLALAGFMPQKQSKAGRPQPKQLLFDFRLERTAQPPKVPMATQRMVLSRVFRKYLTDERRCNPRFEARGDDRLQAARNAGQMVPSIIDMATGSFTAPGSSEIAYIISVSECNASHADNFGTNRVAIFSGQQFIGDADLDFKSTVLKQTDLNGDGADELLMASSYMNQGTLTEMAALLEFPNGKPRVIEDFGVVYEDSCASLMPGSLARASVLNFSAAEPGRMPAIRIDNYRSGCEKARRWRFISTGKLARAYH